MLGANNASRLWVVETNRSWAEESWDWPVTTDSPLELAVRDRFTLSAFDDSCHETEVHGIDLSTHTKLLWASPRFDLNHDHSTGIAHATVAADVVGDSRMLPFGSMLEASFSALEGSGTAGWQHLNAFLGDLMRESSLRLRLKNCQVEHLFVRDLGRIYTFICGARIALGGAIEIVIIRTRGVSVQGLLACCRMYLLQLASLVLTLTVASHAWFGFCLIGIAVHRARLASARWHAPQLRFASSLLPICTSSLGGSEGGRAVYISLPLTSTLIVASHAYTAPLA